MHNQSKTTKILLTDFITHDVKRFILEKPKGYKFIPGQATRVSINKPKWEKKKRPFTFTSLNRDLVLEFIIKAYPEHKGVTEQLHKLVPGDELIIEDPWGTINYKDKGVFIAGGAGITPFIAILRQLHEDNDLEGNRLFFSNKTESDIILQKEFEYMFKDSPEDLILSTTRERKEQYLSERFNKEFLEKNIDDFSQNFYVCGPPKFVESITNDLNSLGAKSDKIVLEE